MLENVDTYLSPELCARNKSFLRSVTETGEVNVTSTMLNRFRRNLSDQNFSVSITLQKVMKKDDFVLPDFKIDIKIKKTNHYE